MLSPNQSVSQNVVHGSPEEESTKILFEMQISRSNSLEMLSLEKFILRNLFREKYILKKFIPRKII